jgi:hypothetical protein
MRSTVLVQGEFVSDEGKKLLDGKVGCDLWITAYAGKPDVKLDVRPRQGGFYGYRNEYKPRQWLYVKSLKLQMSVENIKEQVGLRVNDSNGVFDVGMDVKQWLKYPRMNAVCLEEPVFASEYLMVTNLWPSRFKRPLCDFFWSGEQGTNLMILGAGPLQGWCQATSAGNPALNLAARRFYQNFPGGFSVSTGEVSFLMLPDGGFWPRTEDAYSNRTYQMEGGRYKTWELIVDFGCEGKPNDLATRLNSPLFARADGSWYGSCGAVFPLCAEELRRTTKRWLRRINAMTFCKNQRLISSTAIWLWL